MRFYLSVMLKDCFPCHAEKWHKPLCSDACVPAGMWLSQPKNGRVPGIFVVGIVHWDQCRLSHGCWSELTLSPVQMIWSCCIPMCAHKHMGKKESQKRLLSKITAISVMVRACPEGNHKQQDEVNSPSKFFATSLAPVLQRGGTCCRIQ